MADLSTAQTQGASVLGQVIIYTLLILVCIYYLLPLFVMIVR